MIGWALVHLANVVAKLEELSEQLQHLYKAACDVAAPPLPKSQGVLSIHATSHRALIL